MNKNELKAILALHAEYLQKPKQGKRADLRCADLQGADLRGADLRRADLRRADLRDAYLRGADLRSADLRGAYLRGAYLQGADLRGADLRGADLQDADLRGAYLRGAYLQSADLRGATEYICLGTDPRGYHFRAVMHSDGWQITAGCRRFTVAEATTHWTAKDNKDALARIAILKAHTTG